MASPLLCLLLYLLRHLAACHASRDSVTPGRPLAANETLVSGGDGNFELGFFTPPGANTTYVGVWYSKVSVRTVVWVTNREAPIAGAVADNPGATLSVSADGTLAIAAGNSTVVWSVAPAAKKLTNPAARILDNGNLVLADANNLVAWEGFDYPTDTLLPEMKLGIDYVKRRNRTLTAWKSPSDPSPGPVVMAMDTSGDPQVFIWNGPDKVWRSGPWDGVQFTGVPDTVTYSDFTFSFINNAQEVTYSFQVHNVSIISRLGLNSTGNNGLLQRSTWVEAAVAWNLYWYAPKDQCDAVRAQRRVRHQQPPRLLLPPRLHAQVADCVGAAGRPGRVRAVDAARLREERHRRRVRRGEARQGARHGAERGGHVARHPGAVPAGVAPELLLHGVRERQRQRRHGLRHVDRGAHGPARVPGLRPGPLRSPRRHRSRYVRSVFFTLCVRTCTYICTDVRATHCSLYAYHAPPHALPSLDSPSKSELPTSSIFVRIAVGGH